MDSSDGHSDASDGGGSGRETRRMKEAGASRIKAPKWNCTKSAFSEWCWESEPVWDAKGMHNTYTPDPPLRTSGIKNLGKLLGLEGLRICQRPARDLV